MRTKLSLMNVIKACDYIIECFSCSIKWHMYAQGKDMLNRLQRNARGWNICTLQGLPKISDMQR